MILLILTVTNMTATGLSIIFNGLLIRLRKVIDSDNDDLDVRVVEPVWSETTSGRRPMDFSITSHLLVPLPGNGTPIDFFDLLVDKIFLENICKYIYVYTLECDFSKPGLTLKSRINQWKDPTVPELRTF